MGLLAPLELTSNAALAWLDLVPLSGMGYLEFNSAKIEKDIKSDQSYFKSHPVIGDGALWEKHVEVQFENFERQGYSEMALLHVKSQAWTKLRLLRTPLEAATLSIAFILCELRGEKEVPPPKAPRPFDYEGLRSALASDDPSVSQEAKYTLSIIEKRLHPGRPAQMPNYELIDAGALMAKGRHAAVSAADTCATMRTMPPSANTSKLSWRAPKIIELADYRDFNDTAPPCFSDKNDVPAPAALGAGNSVVVSFRPLMITAKLRYVVPTFGDLLSNDTLAHIGKISKDIQKRNRGERARDHEKQVLKAYDGEMKSPQRANVGQSGYPEFIEKRVQRFFWLEQAFVKGAELFPNGYPIPFGEEVQDDIKGKLSESGVPRDGVSSFLGQLRKFLRHSSKRHGLV